MTSVVRRLGFSLLTTVVLLGAVEFGLRWADWPTLDGAFEHNEPYWVMDPDLRDESVSHAEQGTVFHVSTDLNGLRAPLHSPMKKPGVQRIMALGCSTTYGWGVDNPESYPAQLEEMLEADGYRGVEVINGGQPGYTSFQGLWLWDTVLAGYEPDVVLIGYIVQDARKAAYSDRSQAVLQQDHRFIRDHLLWRSKLYLGLRSMVGGIQVRAKERGEGEQGQWRVPPEDYVANLRGLVERVRRVGAQPVLFGFPLERAGYTELHRKILVAAAKELELLLLDPQEKMEAASREEALYFARDKGHANAAGNARIATWVKSFLEENELIGR